MSDAATPELANPAVSGNGASPRLRLGGMALRNGLLIHGPTSWSIAARAPDGELAVASGRKPTFSPRLAAVPLLRGPLKLLEGFAVVPLARRELPAARLPLEDTRVLAAAGLVTLLSGVLRRGREATIARESIAAALGAIPALVALSDSDLAAYHGVEHKAIGAYEQGRSDPREVPKEHERCGSHLVAPLLVLSIAGQVTLERLLERPGPIARGIAGFAGVAIAAELFAWSERNPNSPLARAFRRPGTEIQRLVATREPTDEQLEVGSAALAEILRAESAASA
ncbi:MAG: DUF1385 domain-containing protein [Solirubrobacterales bacterium]